MKLFPPPRIPTDKIPECKPHIERGDHLRLYRFSPKDYLELAAVFNGPHPETGEELVVIDEAPEGVAPRDLPPQPAVFAPDYAPEDVAEIARKLRERAGLPREATGVVAEGNGARKTPRSEGQAAVAAEDRSKALSTRNREPATSLCRRLPTVVLVLDASAPGTGLGASRLDELLERLQVALHSVAVHPDRAAQRLLHPVRLVVHLDHHLGAGVVEPMERDNAVRPLLPERLPGDAMVGMLLGDLRVSTRASRLRPRRPSGDGCRPSARRSPHRP